MKSTILFLAVLLPFTNGQDENFFRCKPKPGCDFSKCDPIPPHLLEIDGFDAELYRRLNNYHILCQPNFELSKGLKPAKGEKGDRGEAVVGSKGATGRKGEKGDRGDVGDDDKITKAIANGLSVLEKKINAKFEKVELTFANLRKELEQMKESSTKTEESETVVETKSHCDVIHKKSCYWSVVYSVWNVTFNDGKVLCGQQGGQPANIYDQSNYEQIIKHVRSNMPEGRDWIRVWLGLSFDPIKEVVSLSDGSRGGYEKWRPRFPDTGSSHRSWTGIYLYVHREADDPYQGIGNGEPTWTREGVVCEM